MPKIGDTITVHFLDSDYGDMPTVTTGILGAPIDGMLVVGERRIKTMDVWNFHVGPCDHARDQRSDRARENFRRKYE